MKKFEIKIELLLFSILIVIFILTIVNLNYTINQNNIENKERIQEEKRDTVGILLLRIDTPDSIICKRINLTPVTYAEYCHLLQAIVDEGVCNIEVIEYY